MEVHWTIVDFNQFAALGEDEMTALWERSRPVVIAGAPVLMLSGEDLLLHLCVHIAMQHLFAMPLRGYLDLKQVVAAYGDEIEWGLFQQRSRLWGVDRAVRLTLFLAEQWVGLEMPEQVRQAWKPERIDPSLLQWIEERMLGEASTVAGDKLMEFVVRKSILGKLAILWRRFFPARAMLARRYKIDTDGRMIYLYYPMRWFSLFKRYAPTIWAAWRKDAQVLTPLQKENALRQWLAKT